MPGTAAGCGGGEDDLGAITRRRLAAGTEAVLAAVRTGPCGARARATRPAGVVGSEAGAGWGVFAPADTPRAMPGRFGAEPAAAPRDEPAAETLTETRRIALGLAGPGAFRRSAPDEPRVRGAAVRENGV